MGQKQEIKAVMKIFTFISLEGNYNDGEYDFMAKQWIKAKEMAIKFEKLHNRRTIYHIKFNLSRKCVRVVTAKSGFINIRGREYYDEMTELLE